MKKRFLAAFLAAGLVLALAGCVDTNTPKSVELSEQYGYYSDSANKIRTGMDITPEQADEVFLVLVSCGLSEKVTMISEINDIYTVWYGGKSLDISMNDGVVDRVESHGKELYPNPEPEQPDEPAETEPEPEKVYEYDALQNIFMTITTETTAEELWALITENDLSVTVQEYNTSGASAGKQAIFCIAYTDGAARQKYAEPGDYIEIAFDKIGNDSMSNDNKFMNAHYVNSSGLSAMFYNYGIWFDFREEAESEYSGYYVIKPGAKDGITMKYSNGNETATGYFRYNSAEEVIQKMIDGLEK